MPRGREVPNAWGQPGVTSVHVDTAAESGTAWEHAVNDGDAVVCLDTFMCETTLRPDEADALADLLRRAAARARRVQAGELRL